MVPRAGDSGVSSCKNVGSSVRARGTYPQGLHSAAAKGNAERGKGAREKMGFYHAPFPSSSRPSPAPLLVIPRPQGRRDAGACFYGGHDEGQGGVCVRSTTTTGKTKGGAPKGEEGTIAIFGSLLFRTPVVKVRKHNVTPDRFAWPRLSRFRWSHNRYTLTGF